MKLKTTVAAHAELIADLRQRVDALEHKAAEHQTALESLAHSQGETIQALQVLALVKGGS